MDCSHELCVWLLLVETRSENNNSPHCLTSIVVQQHTQLSPTKRAQHMDIHCSKFNSFANSFVTTLPMRVYLHLHSNSRLRITWQYKQWTNSRPTLRYSRTNPIDLIDSPYAISSHDGHASWHASYFFRDKLLRHNYSRNRSLYAPQCLECSDVDKLLRRDMLRSFHVIRIKYQLIESLCPISYCFCRFHDVCWSKIANVLYCTVL